MTPDGRRVWLDGGPVRYAGADRRARRRARRPGRTRADSHAPVSNDSDADLAPDQLAAVTHAGGAARIIAPAGSGKTRVLTERARHLLTRWNVPPSALTLVAFNKRAQEEMQARTGDLTGSPRQDAQRDRRWRSSTVSHRSRPAASLAHDRRTRRPSHPGQARPDASQAQHRSARALDRRAQPGATRAASNRSRPRRGTAVTSTVWPRCGRTTGTRSTVRVSSTSTIRSTVRSRCC